MYIDVFGRHTSFHSNQIILRLRVKQRLRLDTCISPLGDPPLKYTYNHFLLKSVVSPCLSNLLWIFGCLWHLSEISIEERITSFEQVLKRVVRGWGTNARGFGELFNKVGVLCEINHLRDYGSIVLSLRHMWDSCGIVCLSMWSIIMIIMSMWISIVNIYNYTLSGNTRVKRRKAQEHASSTT